MSFETLDVPSGKSYHARGTGTTAQTITPPSDPAPSCCYLTVETNNAYVTFDGSTPSATNGLHILKDTAPLFFPVAEPIKFLPEAGTATMNVMWMR